MYFVENSSMHFELQNKEYGDPNPSPIAIPTADGRSSSL
jgi:hypothetical protein